MKKFVLISTLCLLLSGCALPQVEKTPIPVGGDKAGASVKMAYTYTNSETPVVDLIKSEESARKVCQNWGYKKSKPFVGQTQQCVQSFYQYQLNGINYPQGVLSCYKMQVSIEYQCY